MNDDPNDQLVWFELFMAEWRKMLRGEPYDRNILEPHVMRQDNEDATFDGKNEEQW